MSNVRNNTDANATYQDLTQRHDPLYSEAQSYMPNNTAFNQAANIPVNQLNASSPDDRIQLYPEKGFNANEQMQTSKDFIGEMGDLVKAQVDSDVSSARSSEVLNKLIEALGHAVTPGRLNASTVEGHHASGEVGVTAARTFCHSLLHIIDDGLVWMDATQVSSAARTNFNMDAFQRSTNTLLSNVGRTSTGKLKWGSFWNGMDRQQQIAFVKSLVQMHDNYQSNRNQKLSCTDSGAINPKSQAFAQTINDITEYLTMSAGGESGTGASSAQEIGEMLYNACRSTVQSEASSTVSNQITPSFITNWCVYKKLFMRLQQSMWCDGDVGVSGGYNWASPTGSSGGLQQMDRAPESQSNVLKPTGAAGSIDASQLIPGPEGRPTILDDRYDSVSPQVSTNVDIDLDSNNGLIIQEDNRILEELFNGPSGSDCLDLGPSIDHEPSTPVSDPASPAVDHVSAEVNGGTDPVVNAGNAEDAITQLLAILNAS